MKTNPLILRADATVAMGSGHVMRCLALAQAWQDAGGSCLFLMAESTPALKARLREEGVEVISLTVVPGTLEDAEKTSSLGRECGATWAIVDGYQFGPEYQLALKRAGMKLLVVDDNGHAGCYAADLVLNQNAHADKNLYQQRQPDTRLLLGPAYAVLRREFKSWRNWTREIPEVGRRVLVTMGGSDPDNVTLLVIRALGSVAVKDLEANIVIGGSNPHAEAIERASAIFDGVIRLQKNVTGMAGPIAWADVAVSGAGTTIWEMASLGLPAILIDLAENQRPVARRLDQDGAAIHLGSGDEVLPREITDTLEKLLCSAELRSTLSQRSRKLVDGYGASRVIAAMQYPALRLREAEEKDCRLVWEWANDPRVRAASFSQAHISWQEHKAWFADKIRDSRCLILIGENHEGRPVGQVRMDEHSRHEGLINVNIASQFRGAGYGTQLIDLAVQEVFARTGAARVHAFIRPENQASIRAFERSRFTRLGKENVRGYDALHYVRTRDVDRN